MTLLLPLSVWLMTTFVRDIPSEIQDAARVDGADRWRLVYSMSCRWRARAWWLFSWCPCSHLEQLPNSADLHPHDDSQPLTRADALHRAIRGRLEDMSAAAVVTMLPPFLMALFFQRYLVRGLTMGAVK